MPRMCCGVLLHCMAVLDACGYCEAIVRGRVVLQSDGWLQDAADGSKYKWSKENAAAASAAKAKAQGAASQAVKALGLAVGKSKPVEAKVDVKAAASNGASDKWEADLKQWKLKLKQKFLVEMEGEVRVAPHAIPIAHIQCVPNAVVVVGVLLGSRRYRQDAQGQAAVESAVCGTERL